MLNKLVITIDEQSIKAMDTIVTKLSDKGVNVIKTYPYGVLIATREASEMGSLKDIEGIQDVSIEDSVQLPPKDSDIQ